MATKIGNIYEITAERGKIYFLHLICIDELDLNSDVVAVYEVNPIELNELQLYDKAIFFTHTVVSDGIRSKLWVKIGFSIPQLNLKNVVFKNSIDQEMATLMNDEKSTKAFWYVWNLTSKEFKKVNDKKGNKIIAEDGSVYPANDIIYRLDNGKSRFL